MISIWSFPILSLPHPTYMLTTSYLYAYHTLPICLPHPTYIMLATPYLYYACHTVPICSPHTTYMLTTPYLYAHHTLPSTWLFQELYDKFLIYLPAKHALLELLHPLIIDDKLHTLSPAVMKVWYGMVWYGMVWYNMVWYGMVWYNIQPILYNNIMCTFTLP